MRVRLVKADPGEPARSEPQFEPMRRYPGMAPRPAQLASLHDTAAAADAATAKGRR